MATEPSSPSLPPPHPTPEPDSSHSLHLHLHPLSPSNPNSPKIPQFTSSSSAPPKKPAALPWTHLETINLIRGYQEKWYSLKKGQLKASQWEEVAVTVAARCGYDDPSKSATQCRHKIEKLRKRYRAEKQKPCPNSWQYFDLMESMERGPLPISARPMAMVYQNSNTNSNSSDNDDESDDLDDYDVGKKNYKSKSIDHILRGCGVAKVSRVLQNPVLGKRKECFESDDDEEEDEEEEEEEEEGEGREVVAELASEIRAFAERFVKMENKKMEVMRETESLRMEMENKRMEMILASQRKIADTIGRAFGSHKKLKMVQEI